MTIAQTWIIILIGWAMMFIVQYDTNHNHQIWEAMSNDSDLCGDTSN